MTDDEILARVAAYTMTSVERQRALLDQLDQIVAAGIPGAWVECGVWRGGSVMLMAYAALRANVRPELWLYDTFAGMTEPTAVDVRWDGAKASDRVQEFKTAAKWTQGVSPADVFTAVLSTGYPSHLIRMVVGPVEQTLQQPTAAPDKIALLRLDTDWYQSTKAELDMLWPALQSGGVLLLDDYGYWHGSKLAVDEYLGMRGLLDRLQKIDFAGRQILKP